MYYNADIGVFGGSGFYELGKDYRCIDVDTPYGKPSDKVSLLDVNGKKVAFIPRHGKGHIYSPSEVNYRANVDALAQLGVKAIISPNCVGSLRADYAPGDFVVTDQYINLSSGRKDTFFQSPQVEHLSSADPYDETLRQYAMEEGTKMGHTMHDGGTTVVVNGPRFSTRAESKMFAVMGADLVNMTQYPEAYLCQEKNIPVVNIALVTDYDAGLKDQPGIPPVTNEMVLKVLEENTEKMKDLVFRMIERIGRK
ncbi:MAG: MTAP family purine nucleoside phosphorylase [Eubacteriaceae bacterium]|nr:MTAP family purine nucleoside phosphorylase [Eubacteriaceae bacterium]